MSRLECCRTCFSSNNLTPIFDDQSNTESYANDLFVTTGIKIEKGDMLSQQMCTECISFVNVSINFRKKCEETNQKLVQFSENTIKIEVHISSISDEEELDLHDKEKKEALHEDFVESESLLDDLLKKEIDIVFYNEKKHNKVDLSFINFKVKDVMVDEGKPLKCQFCPKVFKTKSLLSGHLRMHTVPVVCEYCGKKVRDARALLCHYKAKHGYEKTDKCRFCDYRGTKVETVKIHERTHTGEKPYVCASCGAGFHRKSSYLQHVPLHLPEKTVQCDECPAMFKSVTLMRIHKSSRHRRRTANMLIHS